MTSIGTLTAKITNLEFSTFLGLCNTFFEYIRKADQRLYTKYKDKPIVRLFRNLREKDAHYASASHSILFDLPGEDALALVKDVIAKRVNQRIFKLYDVYHKPTTTAKKAIKYRITRIVEQVRLDEPFGRPHYAIPLNILR